MEREIGLSASVRDAVEPGHYAAEILSPMRNRTLMFGKVRPHVPAAKARMLNIDPFYNA